MIGAMARILDALERNALFRGVPREDLSALLVECRLRTPGAGTRVFTAREPAEAFYIVASGRVKLSRTTPRGKEHVVEVMRPGETFALMPALEEGGVYPVDATALGEASLVRVPAAAFRRFLAAHPEVRGRASSVIGERLRRFNRRVEEVATRPVPARVAAHLLALAERDAGTAGAGVVVDLGATREVVAAALGTVREVFIRTLKGMERDGLVAVRGRRVEIRDPERLRAAAEE